MITTVAKDLHKDLSIMREAKARRNAIENKYRRES